MALIPPIPFAQFRAVLREAHDILEQKAITWKRNKSGLNRYGEDTANGVDSITLMVQLNYNYVRAWPVTQETETGGLDRQSVQVLVNKDWLNEKGYINGAGRFEYDPERDRFVIDGLVYKALGDTDASQAGDNPILFTFILKREDTPTGNKR
jgi:hypothetical protein